MAVIYRITNMANGKFYIGSAESFARREWQHKYALRRNEHKNPRLQAAWNKYGEEMFVFEVIEEIAPDRNAFDIENTYLHKVVGQEDCYNVNTDAVGMRTGIPHTEASKAKVSASRKGKAAGEAHYRYGKTVSEETKTKIGNAQRGNPRRLGARSLKRAAPRSAPLPLRGTTATGRGAATPKKPRRRCVVRSTLSSRTAHARTL